MNKVKNKLEKLGWEFKERVDIDYHNGDPDTVYSFKSPRMKDFKDSYAGAPQYGDWNEKKLLKEESSFLVGVRLEKMKDGGGALEELEDKVEEILTKLYKNYETFEYSDKEILEMALAKLK